MKDYIQYYIRLFRNYVGNIHISIGEQLVIYRSFKNNNFEYGINELKK